MSLVSLNAVVQFHNVQQKPSNNASRFKTSTDLCFQDSIRPLPNARLIPAGCGVSRVDEATLELLHRILPGRTKHRPDFCRPPMLCTRGDGIHSSQCLHGTPASPLQWIPHALAARTFISLNARARAVASFLYIRVGVPGIQGSPLTSTPTPTLLCNVAFQGEQTSAHHISTCA